jgi:serine/threonine-protein kinase RsbW
MRAPVTASEVPQQRDQQRGRVPEPGAGPRWCRVFPGEVRRLAAVRRWLATVLPECTARDDVIGIASELAANAVLHSASGRPGGWFAVEVTPRGPVLRVAVRDRGAPAGPRLAADPVGEHGRGLMVVAGLAVLTGVCGGRTGRLVWADVAWPGSAAGLTAGPGLTAAPGISADPCLPAVPDRWGAPCFPVTPCFPSGQRFPSGPRFPVRRDPARPGRACEA